MTIIKYYVGLAKGIRRRSSTIDNTLGGGGFVLYNNSCNCSTDVQLGHDESYDGYLSDTVDVFSHTRTWTEKYQSC